MPRSGLPLFLLIALSLYVLINTYILIRGLSAAARLRPRERIFLLVLILLGILSYPLGRFLGDRLPLPLGDSLVFFGSFYLAFMVYFFLILALCDLFLLFRLLFRLLFKKPRPGKTGPAKPVFLAVIGLVALTVIIGHWNARHPRVRALDIRIPKQVTGPTRITLVMATDIHMGRIIHNHRLEKIVDLINGQNPDLVLLPGDLTDEDSRYLEEQNMIAGLQKLQAPLGVYAVTGNHEYYSGKDNAVLFLQQAGIRVLEDEVLELTNGIRLVGRKDRTAGRFGDPRKPLAELLAGVPPDRPVILMDHQPFDLDEASRSKVDFQLSGHTHNGQLFPFNFIVGRIFETSWGYLRKGSTQFYISCGVGTWGPPVRTSSVPEVVRIIVTFSG